VLAPAEELEACCGAVFELLAAAICQAGIEAVLPSLDSVLLTSSLAVWLVPGCAPIAGDEVEGWF